MIEAPGVLRHMFASMFRGMAGDARNVGSEMAAHMPTLYMLSRYSPGPLVELGVGRGWSTVALLSGVLDSVGRWTMNSYDINPNCEQLVWDGLQLKDRTGPVAEEVKLRWKFHTKANLDVVKEYKDMSVGLCFLDTTHALEATRQELAAWLPKLQANGILLGHDYYLHEHPHWTTKCGVKQAVDEFASQHKDRFNLHVCKFDQGLFILFPK